jgi:pyridoxal 5-phosphate dependent beta-lyase
MARLGSREAFVAGRLGLGVSVAEHLELGSARIRERPHSIAVALRTALADLPAWQLGEPVDAPGVIVALDPRSPDLDVPAAWRRTAQLGCAEHCVPPGTHARGHDRLPLRLSPLSGDDGRGHPHARQAAARDRLKPGGPQRHVVAGRLT